MPSEPPSPKSKNIFNRIASAFHNEELSDRDDLIEVLKEAKSHNLIAADTFSMIEGALSVSDLRASDIMVPRSQVQALDLLEDSSEWIRTIIECGHSRFPAVEGDLDNVVGSSFWAMSWGSVSMPSTPKTRST